MKKTIKKAVIPAAGLGTRFLPATKAMPKELLPIVDIPTLQYIIGEAAASGIEEILLIISDKKEAVVQHFSATPELESFLLNHQKENLYEKIRLIPQMAKISYLYQEKPLGLGHAIGLAKDFVGDEPFAVLLGDDIVHAETPCLKQLIDVYEDHPASILGVQRVAQEAIHKYGIVAPKEKNPQALTAVASLVEKPSALEAPSDLAILGRYIITPAIFDILESTPAGKGGEIQLTDALNTLAQQEDMYACIFDGRRYDVGDQLGFIEANIEYALRREDLSAHLKAYLKGLTSTF